MGMLFVVLAIVVALPVAWIISEFQSRVWLRLALGGLSIFASFGVFYIAARLERLNYNAWYGYATKDLVAAEIEALDAGRQDMLKVELLGFQKQFLPTYENRANYDELATQLAARIRAAAYTSQISP